jgi:hypothetical protein
MSLAENPDNSQIEFTDPDTGEKNSEQSSEVALDVVENLLDNVQGGPLSRGKIVPRPLPPRVGGCGGRK